MASHIIILIANVLILLDLKINTENKPITPTVDSVDLYMSNPTFA